METQTEEKKPETIEEKPPITIGENSNEAIDEVEQAFNEFNKSNSEFKIEEQAPDPNTIDPTEIDLSQAENFKLQIFISLMFTLLDGLHVFIYGFMSKYKITREDIGMDETDKQGLEIYFKTQRVMDLINRLPVEVIGFLHIEYIYFNKFQEFNKRMKEIEPEDPEEEEEESEEEESETAEDKIQKLFDKKTAEFAAKKEPEEKKTEAKKEPEEKKPKEKKAAPKKAAKKAAPKKAVKKPTEAKK